MSMQDRYLIVGLGSIGRRHLSNLLRLRPGCQIAALRSGLSESASPTDEAVLACRTWEEALTFAPQAAIVSGPASTHLESAARLIAAGIPILVEKPLADNMTDAGKLVALAARSRVPAMVGYNLRLLPSLMTTRDMILDGVIGQVAAIRAEVGQYLPDWRPGVRYQETVSARRALGGGPLLELSHEFDYLYWMFGSPTAVTARGGRYGTLQIDVEDVVEVMLEYSGRCSMLANVHLDFLQRAPDRRCRFIGSDGTLLWDAVADTVDVFRISTGQWKKIIFAPAGREATYFEQLRRFIAAAEGGATTLPTLGQAYDVLAVADAAARSMRDGRTIALAPSDPRP